MISYKRFWKKLEQSDTVTRVDLYEKYQISKETISRLQNDQPVKSSTMSLLCMIFDCELEDIAEFVKTEQDIIDFEARIKKKDSEEQ